MNGAYKEVSGWEGSGVDVVLCPDPEQGFGDTQLKSMVWTTEKCSHQSD